MSNESVVLVDSIIQRKESERYGNNLHSGCLFISRLLSVSVEVH